MNGTRIILSLLLAAVFLLGITGELDAQARAVHDTAFERAAGAFVLAKGLNAVISLIQGTELSFTPVGVGLTFTVGEVLDPLNDMVERFSWVMLLASVSLGIQKLLLAVAVLKPLVVALAVVVLAVAAMLWNPAWKTGWSWAFGLRLLALLLMLRFGTIGFVYLQTASFDTLMQGDYLAATAQLRETETALNDVEEHQRTLPIGQEAAQGSPEDSWLPDIVTGASSLFENASRTYDQALQMFDLSTRLEALKAQVDEAQKHIVDLITIFVVQTVLLPLLYLWLLGRTLAWVFRNTPFSAPSVTIKPT